MANVLARNLEPNLAAAFNRTQNANLTNLPCALRRSLSFSCIHLVSPPI